MREPTMFPSTPAATMPKRVMFPSDTLKPANSMIASLGIGMQALSSVMRTNTPASPIASMTLVAALTSGSKMSAGTAGQHYTRFGAPSKGPCVQAPCAAVRGRCGARGDRVRPCVRAALPGRADRDSPSVRDDARRLDRLRRDRQGDRLRGPGAPPQVVALLPAPGHVAGRARLGGREHDPRRGLHAREAVCLQPAPLGGRLRPAAHDPAGGRGAPRPAHDRRAS